LGTVTIINAVDHMKRPIEYWGSPFRHSKPAIALAVLLAAIAYLAIAPAARADDWTASVTAAAVTVSVSVPAVPEPAPAAVDPAAVAPQPAVPEAVPPQPGAALPQYHDGVTAQYHATEPQSQPSEPNVRSSTTAAQPSSGSAAGPDASVVGVTAGVSGAAAAAGAAEQATEVASPTQVAQVLPEANSSSQFPLDRTKSAVSLNADSVISDAVTRNAIEKRTLLSEAAVARSIFVRIGSVECNVVPVRVRPALGPNCAPAKPGRDGLAVSGLEGAARSWLSTGLAKQVSMHGAAVAPAPAASPNPKARASTAARDTSSAPGVRDSTTRTASPPPLVLSASRSGGTLDPAVRRVATRIGETLLRPLRSFGAAGPTATPLHNTRLMLQIGMLFGLAYLGFLALWFWRTRFRGRLGGSARV
jgi:hypothetical protein